MKVIGPLHSKTASGTFFKTLTFSVRKTGQQVRFQKKQRDKITPARTVQRNRFKNAVNMYKYYGFGQVQFGYNLLGSHFVEISSLPFKERAPQFARFFSDYCKFYN